MKFQNLAAFEKHIKASSVVACYIIAAPGADERGKILSFVAEWLSKKHPKAETLSFHLAEDSFASALESLSTRPLFSSHSIIKLDAAEELTKKEREVLEGFITKPSEYAFLLIGTRSLKELTSTITSAKNDIVVLDLTQEKPWDRQKRLQQWVIERSLKEGKKISTSLAIELVDACGPDIMLIEQELVKLITFVGERQIITSEDIKKVGVNYVLPTGWQMAESLLWEGRAPIKDPSFDLSDLLPLLGQLRYHLNTAKLFSLYISEGLHRNEIAQHFPQVRHNSFEKYMEIGARLSFPFFEEALKVLFKIEVLSKNSSLPAGFLWEYLAAQISQHAISYAKKAPAPSAAQHSFR